MSQRPIVSLGFVKDLEVDGDHVSFKVELTTPACPVKDQLRDECRGKVSALPGVGANSALTRRVAAPLPVVFILGS